MLACFLVRPSAGTAAPPPSPQSEPPDWLHVLETNRDRLTLVDSDQTATESFVTTIGPSLQLQDVAGAIAAKGLPSRLSKELMIEEITRSAQRLVTTLVVWHAADAITRILQNDVEKKESFPIPSQAQTDWLKANGRFPSLFSMLDLSPHPGTEQAKDPPVSAADLALAAGQAAVEASLQATAEWWRLKTWKDRVRTLRGQVRLCGTWQWVIHNHQQHHQEQKLSLIFPPPGTDSPGIPGLAEALVLGDTVYLRWEIDGKVQEDSLLFTKESQRLEGTFVNSHGGWGSISGKRTATCGP
jgi:hypothetical protein